MSTDQKLFNLLDLAIAGNYPTWSSRGEAMWRIVSSASRKTVRVQLVAHLLTNFDAKRKHSGNIVRVPGTGITDAKYEPICQDLVPLVDALSETLLTENRTPTTVARRVLSFLENLKSETHRAVAIAMLLRCDLVPYLQIPKDLFQGAPADYAPLHARPSVRCSIALIQRVLRQPRLPIARLGAALQKILTQHRIPDEQNTLICELVKAMVVRLQSASGAAVQPLPIIVTNIGGGTKEQAVLELLRHLLSHIPDSLHTQIIAAHHCADPNCPVRQGESSESPNKPN